MLIREPLLYFQDIVHMFSVPSDNESQRAQMYHTDLLTKVCLLDMLDHLIFLIIFDLLYTIPRFILIYRALQIFQKCINWHVIMKEA